MSGGDHNRMLNFKQFIMLKVCCVVCFSSGCLGG